MLQFLGEQMHNLRLGCEQNEDLIRDNEMLRYDLDKAKKMHMQAYQESGYCKLSEMNKLKQDKIKLQQQIDFMHKEMSKVRAMHKNTEHTRSRSDSENKTKKGFSEMGTHGFHSLA